MPVTVNVHDISRLPENVLELEGNDFYRLTKGITGELFTEVLKIQAIDSFFVFSQITDVFEIFQHDYATLKDLKSKVGFTMDDGTFHIKNGLKIQYEYLSKLLKLKLDHKCTPSPPLSSEKINNLLQKHPILLSLLNFYQNEIASNDQLDFLSLFINTITNNLSASHMSQYRYDEKLKSFAVCLYILGGKTTYEFIRLNLPGALPTLTTINTLIQNGHENIIEAKFRFNQMENYLNSFGVQHAYCAEDCKYFINDID